MGQKNKTALKGLIAQKTEVLRPKGLKSAALTP